jgi:hypothetical protein
MPQRTEDLNVAALDVMPSPDDVKAKVAELQARLQEIRNR